VRILVTGCNGQVGWELQRTLIELGEVLATDRKTLDLVDPDSIRRAVLEAKPEVIINAAAYTAVERAESEPDLAMRINGIAPGVLAEEAKRIGAFFVHYSTDYVFDGAKAEPYTEEDGPNPLNAYGRTKLQGEERIQAVGGRYLILRTSWVYARRGNNFLLTILRLAKETSELRIVNDQRGAPTWARDIAQATAKLLRGVDSSTGLFHLTAEGDTTWYGFAREIARAARLEVLVKPITTAEYPTAAARPANSVLSNVKLNRATGIVLPEWSSSLRLCIAEINGASGPAS
jgi:dTDP-4-dehydrorhamnose reductase